MSTGGGGGGSDDGRQRDHDPHANATCADGPGRAGRRRGGEPGDRGTALPHRRDRQERGAHGGQVLRVARGLDHDAAAGPGGAAAVAGPPPRHGPAHGMAPLGRLHAALDGDHPRDPDRARLRDAERHTGVRDVPEPGRRDRFAARDGRRRRHRRRRGPLDAVRPPAAAVRDLARRAPRPLRRRAPRSRPPDARGHNLHLVPARGRLLVDAVGTGRRCAGGRPGGRAGVAQRPAPVPRRRRRSGVGHGGVGLRHGTRPRPPAGPSGPVLHLAVPRPPRLVAGEPLLPLRRTRRPVRCA